MFLKRGPSSRDTIPPTMTTLERFSQRLKDLRGRTPVKELAARSGVASTALYKAEGGNETVAWKTVEAAYGDLCGSDESYAQLLALWATTQSKRAVRMDMMKRAITKVAEEAAGTTGKEFRAVQAAMEEMDLPEQRDFAAFSKLFAGSRYTRSMAKFWLENEAEMVREMRGKS